MTEEITEITMTAEEARECIQQVNDNLMDTRELLLDLHDRLGWKALGYVSWEKCVIAEFKDKRTYLFYQLAAAKVERNLSQSTIVDKEEYIPESHLRPLAPLPPGKQREVYQKAVETAPEGKVTARYIKETIEQMEEEVTPVKKEKVDRWENVRAKPDLLGDEFLEAYGAMRKALVNASGLHWKTTSREAAEKYIYILLKMTEK